MVGLRGQKGRLNLGRMLEGTAQKALGRALRYQELLATPSLSAKYIISQIRQVITGKCRILAKYTIR